MKAKKEKKKITLREYHKKRMVTGIAILVTEIFEKTAEHYKLDNTTWATVIFVVLADGIICSNMAVCKLSES